MTSQTIHADMALSFDGACVVDGARPLTPR
jgi:hypothetical protein